MSAVTAPIPFNGFCTGAENLFEDRFLVLDFAAPLLSGNEVAVVLRKNDGAVSLGAKFLQYRASDGLWFMALWSRLPDVGDHSRLHASYFDPVHKLIRNSIEVLAVAAIAEDIRQPRSTPRLPYASCLTASQLAQFDRESADVVPEWTRDGYPPQRRLEFSNDPQTVAFYTRRCA